MHARTEPRLQTPPVRSWLNGAKIAERVEVARAATAPATWRAFIGPLLFALVIRVALALLLHAQPSWDGVVYARAADQLAAGEGYTLRILDGSNGSAATAFYPVGYPAVLAFFRLLGGGLVADRLLHALCSALLVPLAFLYARRALGARAARHAAWLSACWPGAILFSATWLAEPLFALACGVALLPVLYARRANLWRALVMSGLLFGAAAYVRPNALLIAVLVGGLIGACAVRRVPGWKHAFWHGALGLAVMLAWACVALSPWTLRNQQRLGAPVLVSTNGGVNLLIGALEEGAFERLPEPQACRRDGLTEVQRDRCFTTQALTVIRSDPSAWLARALLKTAHTFGHESAPAQAVIDGAALPADSALALWLLGVCRIGWLMLLPCAVLGGAVVITRAVRLRARRAAIVLLAPIAAIALVHAVFLAGDRYHGALIPMIAALAGIGVMALARASATTAKL